MNSGREQSLTVSSEQITTQHAVKFSGNAVAVERIMIGTTQFENLICTRATLNREQLIEHFVNFRSKFPVDFTIEYLANLPVDRLRHIFLALCLQNETCPSEHELAA